MPLISKYIFSLIIFVVSNNNHQFKINYETHGINTRNKLNFYQPSSHLSVFFFFLKKGHYMGIKLCNGLTPQIKELTHVKKFESSLLGFPYQHTYYTLDSFINLLYSFIHFILYILSIQQWFIQPLDIELVHKDI
jgi:hypothetical protein